MFHKVHLRLTLLCAGITAAIMIIMSLIYLYVSESGLYDNQFQSFKNDINTITANLEETSVISMEWLSKMEAQGNYLFFFLDNGIPFLYNELQNKTEAFNRDILLQEGLDAYSAQFLIDPSKEPPSPFLSSHFEFSFTSPSTGEDYFCSYLFNDKPSSYLQVLILSPVTSLKTQITDQRLRFLFVDLIAIFLLSVFSWFFTGKLLQPIAENQQKQVMFVSSASHELRTPLAVILSSIECCRNAPSEEPSAILNVIYSESLRMSRLVNDMLTLSQSDNNHFSVCCQPTELDTLVMNSYEAFFSLAKEKSIFLSVLLPDSALPLCICDSERISQVIAIFLHNAISYTPAGGQILLSLFFEKKQFFVTVKDTGIGISNEEKKKVFDRFYRAEKSRSTKGHFGLGLSIAYEIVKSHHGSIKVSDNPEGGCIFTLVLPFVHF